MHPPRSPRISYDILILVIDQLGDMMASPPYEGYQELNTFSLTCRMLLHPCRVHLFSYARIESSATQFVTLLKGDPTIANYMKELSYIRQYNEPSAMSEDLANAFLLLKNIKTLNFVGGSYPDSDGEYEPFDWDLLPPHMQHAFAHLFSSPSINRVWIDKVENLPDTLLSSGSTLKHLTLSSCYDVFSPEASDNLLSPPPQLLSVDLSRCEIEELPLTNRASGLPLLDLSNLRSLAVCVVDDSEEEHFEDILGLTPKLENMQITVSHGRTPDSWVEKLWIVFPTLRSLELTWGVYVTTISIAFPDIIEILEALTYQPNCINGLFLILRGNVDDIDVLPDLDWEGFDKALADRSGFPRLEKLTIQLCPLPSNRNDSWPEESLARLQVGFNQAKSTKFSRLFQITNLDFNIEVHDFNIQVHD